MAIGSSNIRQAKPGKAIVGGDNQQWPILVNEDRAEGWRLLWLRFPGEGTAEKMFWWDPTQKAIVDAEDLKPVELFCDGFARIAPAGTQGLF